MAVWCYVLGCCVAGKIEMVKSQFGVMFCGVVLQVR